MFVSKFINIMKTLQILAMMLACTTMWACENEKKTEPIAQLEVTNPVKEHYIKVALLLDTSNSMDGLIDQAKAQLWEIVNELSYAKCRSQRPNLEIALYEYGNDNLDASDGYIRKVLAFTNDLDDVSKELFSLTTNGGSEFCGTVIQSSLNDLDWGNEADDLKMIFIAGNEPFTQGKIDYRDAANQAKEKDVVVNTIFCGQYQHGVDTSWKDGAKRAYGDYMAIDHNKQTVHVDTPYDDTILQLNIKLNQTYVPYGKKGKAKVAVQVQQDANAESYSKGNAVSRTVSKGSHMYKNSSWDLVDAEEEDDFSYEELEKEALPEALQEMDNTELKAYIETQRAERNKIKEEIARINIARKEYISNNKAETENALEGAMIQAIKKQAGKKNYSWE